MAVQLGLSKWRLLNQEKAALTRAQLSHAESEAEFTRQKALIERIPAKATAEKGRPLSERLADLLRAVRSAENPTRTSIQALNVSAGQNSVVSERQPVEALLQPLPNFPELGSITVTAEGHYQTLPGLEAFLASAQSAGAAITKLYVKDQRFSAAFTLYARVSA